MKELLALLLLVAIGVGFAFAVTFTLAYIRDLRGLPPKTADTRGLNAKFPNVGLWLRRLPFSTAIQRVRLLRVIQQSIERWGNLRAAPSGRKRASENRSFCGSGRRLTDAISGEGKSMTNSGSHWVTVLVATILAIAAITAHFLTHLHSAAATGTHIYIFNTVTGKLVRVCHVAGGARCTVEIVDTESD